MENLTPSSNNSLPSGYKWVVIDGVSTMKSVKWYQRRENLKGNTGKWSKWGEVHNVYQEETDSWFCQKCGKEQPDCFTAYLFPLGNSTEQLRICGVCGFEMTELKTQTVIIETVKHEHS